jgi:hypothetical protein
MDTETIEQPRADNGQFTSGETLTGLASVERDAGYTQFSTPQADDAIDGDPESLRAAFDDAVARGVDVGEPDYDPDPIVLQGSDGTQLPENVTVTAEQAGAALSGYQHQVGSYVEGMALDNLTDQIDQARAAVLKNDPNLASEYGLDAQQVQANAQKFEQKAENPEQADAAKEPVSETPGLDPKLAEALAHPQVRAAVEEQISKASETQQQYAAALNMANQVSMARLAEIIPDVAGLPPEQRQAGLEMLAQVDRPRFDRAMQELKQISDIHMAAQQYQQHQAAQQQHQFQTYKAEQDAKFDQAVGPVSNADQEALRTYVYDVLGLSPEEASTLHTNPTVVDHRFQKALLDASRFHAMQNATKPVATRNLPPVVRPGAAGASRGSDNSSKIAALNAALDGATTESAQLNIAREILRLRGAT